MPSVLVSDRLFLNCKFTALPFLSPLFPGNNLVYPAFISIGLVNCDAIDYA